MSLTAELDIFTQLMNVITQRMSASPNVSYTAALLAGGTGKVCEKIAEEARELVEAASEEGTAGHAHRIHEAADLIYHTWVYLAQHEIALDEVKAELQDRIGTSGLAEKASRHSNKDQLGEA